MLLSLHSSAHFCHPHQHRLLAVCKGSTSAECEDRDDSIISLQRHLIIILQI